MNGELSLMLLRITIPSANKDTSRITYGIVLLEPWNLRILKASIITITITITNNFYTYICNNTGLRLPTALYLESILRVS
jgi:hypothetical protein